RVDWVGGPALATPESPPFGDTQATVGLDPAACACAPSRRFGSDAATSSKLLSVCFDSWFCPSIDGNSDFWHNVSLSPLLPPSPGNKNFGAIRGGGGKREEFDFSVGVYIVTVSCLDRQTGWRQGCINMGPAYAGSG